MRRYLNALRPHAAVFALAAVLMSVNALIPGAVVLLVEQTLDDVLVRQGHRELVTVCLGFVGLYALAGVLTWYRTRLTKTVAWRMAADLRLALHRHLLTLSPEQRATVGERLAALGHDIDEVQYGVSAVVTAVRAPLTLVVLAAVAVTLAPVLAGTAVLLSPFVVLPGLLAGRYVARLSRRQREHRARLLQVAQEQQHGVQTLQAVGAVTEAVERFSVANEADHRARRRLDIDRVLPRVLVQGGASVGIGILLYLGGTRVLEDALAPGQLLGFAVAIGLMSRPLGQISEMYSLMKRSVAALERVYGWLAVTPDVCTPDTPQPLGEGAAAVRLSDVRVDYGQGEVLRGIDLTVSPGEWLALVGPSGGGKTTILRLLWRQRDPSSGTVQIDGVPLPEAALTELRSRVAVVLQDDVVFSGTVADNVQIGRRGLARSQVERALEEAGATFVFALPAGMDTEVAELGKRLSGGEGQRISLARALAGNAGLILLDEATNQVDPETERQILDALSQQRGSRTLITVAHDPAVARAADRIAVVVDGKIAEVGTHDALLRQAGTYARMLG